MDASLSERRGLGRPQMHGERLSGTRLLGALTVIVVLILSPFSADAQELLCDVSVNYSQVSGSDFDFLGELEEEIEEYLNVRQWTDDRFEPNERILCSISIVIHEALSLTEFEAQLVVTSFRPIYGTVQNTRVVQISDQEWTFQYSRGRPLIFDLESYDSLTSVLDFYAFLLMGYDYDTFSELGGSAYFTRARRIAEIAQRSGDPGWGGIGASRTRGELITQLLDHDHRPLREAYFAYHYRGLDHFIADPEDAQGEVLGVLQALQQLSRDVPRSYAIDLFFNTKYRELVALFEDSGVRSQAYNVLVSTDPSNSTEYRRLAQ